MRAEQIPRAAPKADNVEAIYYLTPLQHGMLYHSQREPAAGIYVEQFSCLILGPLQARHFADAWSVVVHRHAALKTLFVRLHEEKPMQVVRKEVKVPFAHVDWSGLGADVQERRFAELLRDDRRRGFDAARAPLMRLHLIELGADRRRFLWTYHHAILDGWSMPIVLHEVFQAYAAARVGRPLELPPPCAYKTYVSWLRSQDGPRADAFWRELLAGFRRPLAFAPSMAPRGETAGRQLARAGTALPPQWREAAQRVCREHRITLNTLCQGAWSLLLGRYGNTDDVVYGTVVSGRPLEIAGIERLVGLCINTLPARVRLPEDMPLAQWLQQLQALNLDIERFGYSALADIQQAGELPPNRGLFDTLYVFENYPGHGAFAELTAAHGLEVQDIRAAEETNYALALILVPQDEVQLQLTYAQDRFSRAAIERLLAHYRRLLGEMLRLDGMRVGDLQLEAEPAAGAVVPPALTLYGLLTQQAAAHPQQPALISEAGALTYRELVALVERYRAEWPRHGFRPGERVWIRVDNELLSVLVLLSGISYGIECVVADDGTSPEALQSLALAGLVVDTLPRAVPARLRLSMFPLPEVVTALPADDMPADRAPGACWVVAPDGEGWTAAGYGEPAIANFAAWFAQTYPVMSADAIPLTHAPLAAANIWTTLGALGSGLTLHCLGRPGDNNWTAAVRATGRAWHSVRLSHVQTRSLSHGAPPSALAVDYVVLDAAAVTARALAAARSACPQARVAKEWRAPAGALAHAHMTHDERMSPEDFLRGVGRPVAGSALTVLDRGLRPTSTDAFGVLGVVGATVPALAADSNARRCVHVLTGGGAPMLLTNLTAWRSDTAVYAQLLTAETSLPDEKLREAEGRLRALAGIEDAAIVERVGANAEWERVVYYVSDVDDPEPQIHAALADAGIAVAALVRAARLPRQERRLDRDALVRGDVEAVSRGAPIAARDDVERKLQSIWQELLKREPIGITDNYFELGGQSLLATVMLHRVEEELAVRVPIERLLEHPTIAGLADIIKNGAQSAQANAPDLAREAVLDERIVPAAAFDRATFAPESAFLTGATGFLGAHLLADLLARTEADVYCLVRAAEAPAGMDRLVAALKKYRLWDERYRARLWAIPGELDRPAFGLNEEQFAALAHTVDVIYHNGAQVNFVYPYSSLKQANVTATQEILRLACLHKTKPVHYVSTVGVLDRHEAFIAEDLAVPLHARLAGGYEQSKWVAEQLVVAAATRGLPVAIYRPSRIVGHTLTGQMNTDDLFCRMIKGIVAFGLAPYDAGFDNIVPVDVASRVIVECSLQPQAYGRAFHVINPAWHSLNAVIDFIAGEGYAVGRVDYATWLARLSEHVRRDREHPLAMLVPVLQRLNPVVDPSISRILPIDQTNVDSLLGGRRRAIPEVQMLLRVYFDYFYSVGFLAPADRRVAIPS